MTLMGAVRWSLRPKRVAVLLAKLLLMGATDLAAQTNAWQNVNGGILHVAIQLDGAGHWQHPDGERADMKINREMSFDLPLEGAGGGDQSRFLQGLPLTARETGLVLAAR